jgi:hypothetical protein
MSCKFSRNTACTGKLRKLESLSPEDTEILLSEHGFLRIISLYNLKFVITTMHKPEENRRRWVNRGKCCVPTSIAAHKGTSTTGNRKITPEILERIHSSTGLVVPIGSRKHILIFQLKLIFTEFFH